MNQRDLPPFPNATQFTSHPAKGELLFVLSAWPALGRRSDRRWIRLCSVRAGRWWPVVKQEEEFIVT